MNTRLIIAIIMGISKIFGSSFISSHYIFHNSTMNNQSSNYKYTKKLSNSNISFDSQVYLNSIYPLDSELRVRRVQIEFEVDKYNLIQTQEF